MCVAAILVSALGKLWNTSNMCSYLERCFSCLFSTRERLLLLRGNVCSFLSSNGSENESGVRWYLLHACQNPNSDITFFFTWICVLRCYIQSSIWIWIIKINNKIKSQSKKCDLFYCSKIAISWNMPTFLVQWQQAIHKDFITFGLVVDRRSVPCAQYHKEFY